MSGGVGSYEDRERNDEEQRAARTHIVLSTNCCIVDLFHIVNTRSFILEVRQTLNIERRSGVWS